jgi:hypothetical protein
MTDRAEATEISCSLERPPATTATRTRRLTGAADWAAAGEASAKEAEETSAATGR